MRSTSCSKRPSALNITGAAVLSVFLLQEEVPLAVSAAHGFSPTYLASIGIVTSSPVEDHHVDDTSTPAPAVNINTKKKKYNYFDDVDDRLFRRRPSSGCSSKSHAGGGPHANPSASGRCTLDLPSESAAGWTRPRATEETPEETPETASLRRQPDSLSASRNPDREKRLIGSRNAVVDIVLQSSPLPEQQKCVRACVRAGRAAAALQRSAEGKSFEVASWNAMLGKVRAVDSALVVLLTAEREASQLILDSDSHDHDDHTSSSPMEKKIAGRESGHHFVEHLQRNHHPVLLAARESSGIQQPDESRTSDTPWQINPASAWGLSTASTWGLSTASDGSPVFPGR